MDVLNLAAYLDQAYYLSDGDVADLDEGDMCDAPYEGKLYPAKILLRSLIFDNLKINRV